ncbi:MAG: uroporphyrinogen decarboxylase family protein [Bacteroidales bacterium]
MSCRERVLCSLRWDNPKGPVVESYCSAATWHHYRDKLFPIAIQIPSDFYFPMSTPPDYDSFPKGYAAGEIFVDAWGCEWTNKVNGMQGIVSKSPLESWDSFEDFKCPDPKTTADLYSGFDIEAFKKYCKALKDGNKFVITPGSPERLWERVHFLRGYENSLIDMAEDDPRIRKLIDMIVQYNIENTSKYIDCDDLDCVAFQDDWGEQYRLMVSPEMWYDFFFEGYKAMFQHAKKLGKYVYFHTDGHLLPVIPYLIEAGADIINIQSGCNDLQELRRLCLNKVTVSADIDRQYFMPFATAEQLKGHIIKIYEVMEGHKGGLWFKADIYPDTPLENIQAIADVLNELRK